MNAELKAKWVEALRSGKYKQGRGTLRRKNGTFCCLGVLCDVESPDGWMAEPLIGNYIERVDGCGPGYLPVRIAEAAALMTKDQEYLVVLNDSDRASFSEIANYIEANL